jgi:hypothetical protein
MNNTAPSCALPSRRKTHQFLWSISCTLALLLNGLPSATAADRSLDGTGNNPSHPAWGSAGTNFSRLFGVTYYNDGMAEPAGGGRANPRYVSNMLGDQPLPMQDVRGLSDFTWQWGQFLDHDITLRRTATTEPMPIMVPFTEDPLQPLIPFARSAYDPLTGSSLGSPREQITDTTAFVDASMVYGTTADRAAALRTFAGGLLATSQNGELMPYNTGGFANDNEAGLPTDQLFLAGDPRANEHVGLTAMHTLWVREHNRLATELSSTHPTWSDEELYQHARKTVGALIQSITYQEYLPALLGDLHPDLTTATYDPAVDPSIANEFATAAFRLGHTQVSPQLLRMTRDGVPAAGGPMQLKESFFLPSYFQASEDVDLLLMGMSMQVQQRTDTRMPSALRDSMFGAPGQGGMDLFAINLQRGRDHGLPTFNELLEQLPGMEPATDWSDISSHPETIAALEAAYGNIEDLDLWAGLLAQDTADGAAVGPALQAVVAEQFRRLMVGDRFFYLWDDGLTELERQSIGQTRLSDVILRNTSLTHLQSNVFFVPEPASGLGWGALMVGSWVRARRRRYRSIHSDQ